MFGPTESDTCCTEFAGYRCFFRCVGIGTHLHAAVFIGQLHQLAKITAECCLHGGNLAFIYFTSRAVERNPVPFLPGLAFNGHRVVFVINVNGSGTGHTTFAHSPCDHSGVRGHTPTRSEDTFSHTHTAQVFGRSFEAHQNDRMAFFGPFFSLVSKKYDLASSCAWGGR